MAYVDLPLIAGGALVRARLISFFLCSLEIRLDSCEL